MAHLTANPPTDSVSVRRYLCDRFAGHLRRALRDNLLCSNDPVCAEHAPDSPYESRPLHGAACHGCLLIAETSCEQRNDFLDRALVVPTVGAANVAFFDMGCIDP